MAGFVGDGESTLQAILVKDDVQPCLSWDSMMSPGVRQYDHHKNINLPILFNRSSICIQHLSPTITLPTHSPPTAFVSFLHLSVVRGPKHHLKRLNAPSSWMLDKLSGTYAPRPSNGPHKLREALPLVVSIQSSAGYLGNWSTITRRSWIEDIPITAVSTTREGIAHG